YLMRHMMILLIALLLSATSCPAFAQACAGDCDGSRSVSVDEIVRGVNIALGTIALSQCEAFDVNHDQAVTVDELLAAVNAALNGCPPDDREAFIVLTNFSEGSFGTISLDTPRQVTKASAQ